MPRRERQRERSRLEMLKTTEREREMPRKKTFAGAATDKLVEDARKKNVVKMFKKIREILNKTIENKSE